MSRNSVIFVCMGNICRSPAGEGVMKHVAQEAGLTNRVRVDSAGTIDFHSGNPADTRMREAAARRGYDLTSQARGVTRDDLEQFDLVIAMDRDNRSDLLAIAPSGTESKIRLLSDFLPGASERDVPDPYYGGARGFETVLDMIEEACPGILEELTG